MCEEDTMNISNNIASIGFQQETLNKSAQAVANINKPPLEQGNMQTQTDLSKEMTTQIVAQNATEANVSSIKSADEMFGSLLDIKA